MPPLFEPELAEVPVPAVLQALGDAARLRIVAELAGAGEEGRVCGSVDLGLSKATRSHHFRVLREAGVTRTEVLGAQRVVRLRREELDARFPGLLDAVLERQPA